MPPRQVIVLAVLSVVVGLVLVVLALVRDNALFRIAPLFSGLLSVAIGVTLLVMVWRNR